MKSAATKRTYRQSRRAQASEENTQRILEAGLQLFAERPFDQIALADVAERAGVGLQTVIRRVGTKDGLARAINESVSPQVGGDRDEPVSADPAYVAAAVARQYERWGMLIDRMLRQRDASPALAENAEAGRAAHRAWIDIAFAGVLEAQPPAARRSLRARLVAVCGVELWLVLRRDEGLSAAEARDAVAALITACLPTTTPPQEP